MLTTGLIPVMEHFYTIQGEGFYTGQAAYFIRLGGCDVGCHWCDVKESWPITGHPMLSIDFLVNTILATNVKIVVITGGEPFMHNLDSLTNALRLKGLRTHVETSGTHPISGKWDWICLSPKKFKTPRNEYFNEANELKIIVFNKTDLEFAEEQKSKLKSTIFSYLQPEWGNQETVTPLIVAYIKSNPDWRISLQTHKYLNIP